MREPDNPTTLCYEGSNFYQVECNPALWARIVQTLQSLILAGPG